MIDWLRSIFNNDVTVANREWLSQTLRILSYAAIFATVLIGIALIFLDRGYLWPLILVIASLIIETSSFYFYNRNRVYLGALIIVVFLWTVFSFDLMFFTGIRGMSVYGQLLVIFASGLIFRGTAAIWVSVATLIVDFFVFYREYVGIEPIAGIEGITWARYIITSIFIVMFALVVKIVMNRIDDVLAQNMDTLRRYQSLFEHSTDAVIIMNRNLEIEMVNDSGQVLFGYSSAELAGRDVFEFIPKKYHPTIKRFLPLMQRGRNAPFFELELPSKGGRELIVEGAINIVHDTKGNPSHIQLTARNVTARRHEMEALRKSASYDPLTKIGNRRMFIENFKKALTLADQINNNVVLFFIDLDGFKQINDRYGHIFGDELLRQIAGRLQAIAEENMTVTRLGGDEFAIFIAGVEDVESALAFGHKILKEVTRPMMSKGHKMKVGCSIGASVYPLQGKSFRNMLELADRAMYQAKETGSTFHVSAQPKE